MRNESAFAKVLEQANKMKAGAGGAKTFDEDKEKYWKAEQDKAGNGYAVIRFLPGKTEDDAPFNKIFNHGFKNSAGKWFIENCPTTLGHDCPVCAMNGDLVAEYGDWAKTPDAQKNVVRGRKRKLSFVTNVLVVEDKKNPDNEGKVFIFKFGKKIFDKITDAMQPPMDDKGELIDPDYPPINPFDALEGANFKLKIRRVEGFANFDKSEFEKPSEIKNFDDLVDQMHDLAAITDPSQFKSYEEIDEKLKRMLGGVQRPARTVSEENGFDADADDDGSAASARADREAEESKPTKPKASKAKAPVADDEDEDDAYFRELAEG